MIVGLSTLLAVGKLYSPRLFLLQLSKLEGAGFNIGYVRYRLIEGFDSAWSKGALWSVVVGGTAITGGVGSIWRTLVGALIISVVRIGMTFLGVNIFAQNIVFGAVLVLAVAITIDRSKIPIVK